MKLVPNFIKKAPAWVEALYIFVIGIVILSAYIFCMVAADHFFGNKGGFYFIILHLFIMLFFGMLRLVELKREINTDS